VAHCSPRSSITPCLLAGRSLCCAARKTACTGILVLTERPAYYRKALALASDSERMPHGNEDTQ